MQTEVTTEYSLIVDRKPQMTSFELDELWVKIYKEKFCSGHITNHQKEPTRRMALILSIGDENVIAELI